MAKTLGLMSRMIAVAETAALRSDLARWMAANHDAFAAMLKTYRPRWEMIAEQLVAEKLLSVPDEYSSGDPAVRAVARKQAGRAAKRAWDRTHAKMKHASKPVTLPVAQAASAARLDADGARQAVVGMLENRPSVPPAGQDGPPPARKPIVLRPARTIGPTEAPDDDGSKLPKPQHRVR
jgi:hypothetical protein